MKKTVLTLFLSTTVICGTEQGDHITTLILKKAEQGDATSQFELGTLYYYGTLSIKGDMDRAIYWYERAAQQGNIASQSQLGYVCYYLIPYRLNQAFYWCQRAAEQGHVGSQLQLGGMYLNGHGTKQNDFLAAYWFNQARVNGYPLTDQLDGLIADLSEEVKLSITN